MPLITFSGIASGIDTEGLIDATKEALQLQRINPLEDKVSELDETNTSLEELQTKMIALKDHLATMGTLAGGAVTKIATSSDETAVTATASKSASNGTYTITPNTLATNATWSIWSGDAGSGEEYTSPSDAIGPLISDAQSEADRTITIDVGTGDDLESISVVLTSTTSLDEFATSINNATSRVTASVVNVGTSNDPDYRVVMSSNEVGTERGTLNVTTPAYITGLGYFDNNADSGATDAEFTISGISGTITRSSNTVSDVISGVTFNLESASGSPTTISIDEDSDSTLADMQEFIDQYNEIVTFIAENNLVVRQEDGEDVDNIFAALAKTSVDDNALTALRSALSGTNFSDGSTVKIFADLGVTTDRDGTLKFDTDKFQSALASEPNSVENILNDFADTTSVTGGTIDQFSGFNRLFDVVIQGNKEQISDLNDRIATQQQFIAKQEELLRLRFARLESLIGGLQSQQAALTSALAGLGGG